MDLALLTVVGGTFFDSPAKIIFAIVLLLPILFFGGSVLYLWALMSSSLTGRRRLVELYPLASDTNSNPNSPSQNLVAPSSALSVAEFPRFAVLIPAHNEELLLGLALESLNRLEYPRDRFHLVVVADNCSDRTAGIAREKGAIALERFNTDKIGKGYALEWALKQLMGQSPSSELIGISQFDAVVILDADTQVASNLLSTFAASMGSGEKAMQVRYEVLNPYESWRTKLMCCALSLVHIVKPLGRERWKLSDGLKGNGMCFAREVVERVPWSGESITEDIEYTIRLCRAGYRVAFLPESAVWAQMPTTGAQSASQRKRWEGGRYHLLSKVAPALLMEGLKKRDWKLLDRAVELIIPPFAEMFAFPFVFMLACLATSVVLHWQIAVAYTLCFALMLIMQAVYLFGGMWIAKVPASIARTALYAPGYIVWKFALYGVMIATRSAGGWKRTERRSVD